MGLTMDLFDRLVQRQRVRGFHRGWYELPGK
jgi:hypothetical protein